MKQQTRSGRNVTGTQMSPADSEKMQQGVQDLQPAVTTQDRGDIEVRRSYSHDVADGGLGSVPVPVTVKGKAKSRMDRMTGDRPEVLVDKLGERMAFERTGVRLYEMLLMKCEAVGRGLLPQGAAQRLRHFRDEELEHFTLVGEVLQQLGCDPTAQTPCADLVGVQSMGIVQGMSDPRTTLPQALHLMLDAELLDHAGWEMLIDLARATGHDDMAGRFETALQQESEHLATLRELVSTTMMADASLGARPAAKAP